MYSSEAETIGRYEVQSGKSKGDESELGTFIDQLTRRNRIFVIGDGSIILMLAAFLAKGLSHLRFEAFVPERDDNTGYCVRRAFQLLLQAERKPLPLLL